MIRLRIRLLLLLFLVLPAALRAQPGGGGGIGLRHLYGRQGHRLVPLSWAAAQARMFVLAGAAGGPEAAVAWEDYAPNWNKLTHPVRLLLVYQADTMVLDLDHLQGPNGMGATHRLDSLVVLPGYFHYADTVSLADFTPHTVAALLARRQLSYRPHARLAFLAANRLGAAYYLALSQHQLRRHQPDSALAALDAAEARQPSLRRAPLTAGRRARAYQQLGRYAVAVRWATRALALAQQPEPLAGHEAYANDDNPNNYSVVGIYRQRRHLHLLQRDYRAALADYDSLAAFEARRGLSYVNAPLPAIARAFFLADSLHQVAAYGVAAQLLHQVTAHAPAWPCQRWVLLVQMGQEAYVTNTAAAYFRLGLADYRAHQVATASQHWRQAMVEGLAYETGTTYVAHFDSLLARWPRQPLLWLGRAIAHLHYSEVPVKGDAEGWTSVMGNYSAALHDLNRAEQLGYADAEVYYYRALAFKELRRWGDMRRQLDLAISKAPQAGELYQLRYQARVELGQATWNNPADVDFQAYERLCSGAR